MSCSSRSRMLLEGKRVLVFFLWNVFCWKSWNWHTELTDLSDELEQDIEGQVKHIDWFCGECLEQNGTVPKYHMNHKSNTEDIPYGIWLKSLNIIITIFILHDGLWWQFFSVAGLPKSRIPSFITFNCWRVCKSWPKSCTLNSCKRW